MKRGFARIEDSTFDLNLAPMLDIIVSIVPMLLMSLAFVQVTMIETPIPQAVEKAMAVADKRDDLPQISVALSSAAGFTIDIEAGGHKEQKRIPLKNGALDFDTLHATTVALKIAHPDAFRVELHPEESVPLEQIVATMDQVRNRAKSDPTVFFTDVTTGKKTETELLFPDVVFGNVSGSGSIVAGG